MQAQPLSIHGVLLFTPKVFHDARGYFYESYHLQNFDRLVGHGVRFVQDNQSRSSRGVVRGLHYQIPPHAQAKLVRCVAGEIFDVVVDVRRQSPTFGQWASTILSDENRQQLWIPEGCAHGFMALSEHAEIAYKTTDFYHQASERSIRWNDPDLAIAWPMQADPVLSDKDRTAPLFAQAEFPD